MKLATLILTAALTLAFYSHDGNQSVAHKRQAKLFYDRIEVGTEPVRVQRCQTPHTIWYHDGKCYKLDRLPRSRS